MRRLTSSPYFPIHLSGFLTASSFCALTIASWIILMDRFNVTPVIATMVSVSLCGFALWTDFFAHALHKKISLIQSQRIGCTIGAISAIALIFIQSLPVFVLCILIASFSQVALESTFPKITHKPINENRQFSSIFSGSREAAFLASSGLIAVFALRGHIIMPMLIAVFFYIASAALTFLYPGFATDSSVEDADLDASNRLLERRISDNNKDLCVRKHQSSFHKFRRLSSTLISAEFMQHFIAGGAVAMLPLVLADISNLSQGVDASLSFIYGIFAAPVGLIGLVWLRKKYLFSEGQEWIVILGTTAFTMFTMIFYTTVFGLYAAVFAAAINGIAWTANYAFIHDQAARNLTHSEYSVFGCKFIQAGALARITGPIITGLIAMSTSIQFAIGILAVTSMVFLAVLSLRTYLILKGRTFDNRLLTAIRNIDITPEAQAVPRAL